MNRGTAVYSWIRFVALACVLSSLTRPVTAQSSSDDSLLKVGIGNTAPDFVLRDQHGQKIALSDFRGKKTVVLAFYVFAFTDGCAEELQALDSRLSTSGAQLLGVSTDSIFANSEFAARIGISYPLLSDKSGAVSRRYGLFNPVTFTARRATLVISKAGKIMDIQLDHNALTVQKTIEAVLRLP